MKFNALSIGLIPVLAIGFNLALSKPSYAWLGVCNETGGYLNFSAAAQFGVELGDLHPGDWSTWGTWRLAPGDCWRTLNNDLDDFNSGRYDLGNVIYYHAESDSGREWRGDNKFCVSPDQRVREIHFKQDSSNAFYPWQEENCDLFNGKMVQMRKLSTRAKDYYLTFQ